MIRCQTRTESWALHEPFEIARETITDQAVLLLTLTDAAGHSGQAEAAGVDYDGETPARMAAQIAALLPRLHDGLGGTELLDWLPAGGARNALDCALWDLRAKQSGTPVWQAAGLPALQPVTTAFTIGLGDEATTRRKARAARHYPLLKLKVDAQRHLDVVRWVREEHPGARLVVDANQAWSPALLRELLPQLAEMGVELVEQPLARGLDAALDGLQLPIPLAADESCTDRASLPALVGRYQFVNIKLDKCGGLTEALALAAEARRLGLGLMVGNMCGSSLAMAPAFLLAQSCSYVDLDGPLLQQQDRAVPLQYDRGVIQPPSPALWG
ncbi:L-alanine-DL-glutamate epimerase-like enolase superfamily enzyme [Rhodoferax ferrireducens]|uniref:Dipeptide epimerase n=1 Tax=Rhodoferax ferrireducens TaxID=192843 RepID=A0ABU2C9F0_9BURK|nr:N-acetyl-D-Glu racemase DgcA [Rhodoferax ferrireducens]MDR7377943.1 L-alanine-DL-glutamate epimerase-like enolase superfamily enzyme [Rhodoferax ferrireducens]